MPRKRRPKEKPADDSLPGPLRVIGGRFRGRKLKYSGDPRTRPMKQRVREAVFNLVGPTVVGKHAIDLFAGTGGLGLEALSRGAAQATFIERHFPTAAIIGENIAALEVDSRCEVFPGDTFIWGLRAALSQQPPWLVFCSPPYDLYVDRCDDLLALVASLLERAAAGSVFVVEADARFDFSQLPRSEEWDVRSYPPAWVGLLRVT